MKLTTKKKLSNILYSPHYYFGYLCGGYTVFPNIKVGKGFSGLLYKLFCKGKDCGGVQGLFTYIYGT